MARVLSEQNRVLLCIIDKRHPAAPFLLFADRLGPGGFNEGQYRPNLLVGKRRTESRHVAFMAGRSIGCDSILDDPEQVAVRVMPGVAAGIVRWGGKRPFGLWICLST